MRSRATNFWGHLEGNELVKQSKETAAALPILRVSIRRRGVADRAFFHSRLERGPSFRILLKLEAGHRSVMGNFWPAATSRFLPRNYSARQPN